MLRINQSFEGREDRHLADRLLKELPGIMGGAIAHYRKVRERGDVLIPASSREALNELRKQWAPAMAFADACLKIGAGLSVPKSLVYLTYKRGAMQTVISIRYRRGFRRRASAGNPIHGRELSASRRQ